MKIFPNIKGLIFDCDGTLVDSMPLHMDAWRETFKAFDTIYHEDFLFSCKGMKETDIINLYNQKFGTGLDAVEMVTYKHQYFKNHIHQVKPIHVVSEIARHSHGKLPLAVVSGSLRNIVYEELQLTGLISLFEVILTGDDPFKPKPDPEIFLEAARRIKVQPEFCQVFEDGDSGIEAAKKAGMVTTDVRLYI